MEANETGLMVLADDPSSWFVLKLELAPLEEPLGGVSEVEKSNCFRNLGLPSRDVSYASKSSFFLGLKNGVALA